MPIRPCTYALLDFDDLVLDRLTGEEDDTHAMHWADERVAAGVPAVRLTAVREDLNGPERSVDWAPTSS